MLLALLVLVVDMLLVASVLAAHRRMHPGHQQQPEVRGLRF